MPDTPIDQITHIASTSPVAGYRWKGNRGVAPAGYIKGMALTYARVYCKLKAGEAAATDMAKVDTRDNEHDALSWYRQKFAELELSNDTAPLALPQAMLDHAIAASAAAARAIGDTRSAAEVSRARSNLDKACRRARG